MSPAESSRKRVAVVGGGISGLATAHRLNELDPQIDVSVLEKANRTGGVLDTQNRDGFLLEWGADNFITNVPWALELCRRIGFEDQLVQTDENHRGAFVVRNGRLRKIPQGFIVMAPSRVWPVITTPILGPFAKLRMAGEYFVPKRNDNADESLAAFVIRRFGRQTYERLVQPLIGGIYTGDPAKLSLQSTMPRFRDMEKKHGSLIRAVMKQAKRQPKSDRNTSGGRYSMFVAPRDGIASLLKAMADRLPPHAIRIGEVVTGLGRQSDGRWQVDINQDRRELFDAVVLATPAKAASSLINPHDQDIARALAEIHHSGCSIVTLAFKKTHVKHPLDGFGFVVPAVENRQILSGSFSSVKYPGRAPDDQVLMRVFIGGALQPELVDLADEKLIDVACCELSELLGISGDPTLVRIARLPASMPQYYVGHRERIARIRSRASDLGGLFLTGNAYDGVGIPFCIHGGETTAQQVLEFLAKPAAYEEKQPTS
jgi:oxygen-dependent protoporphyrinogen oxidase